MNSIKMDPTSSQPAKRHKPDCGVCILCKKEVAVEKLTGPKDLSSWLTLLNAAKIRNYEPVLQFSDSIEQVPESIRYETPCRNRFTNKKDLEAQRAGQCGSVLPQSTITEPTRARRQSTDVSERVYPIKCIFCDRESKYAKGRSREKLVKCRELRVDETLRSVAVRNIAMPGRTGKSCEIDNRILALTSREIVAAEAHYHHSCYKDYTRMRPEKPTQETDDAEEAAYKAAESDGYEQLFDYIRTSLIDNPSIVPLSQLTLKLEEYMHTLGIAIIKPSTKKHIRRVLETKFGSTLQFIVNYNNRVLVTSNALTKETLAKENFAMKEQLRLLLADPSDSKGDISRIAARLRNHIKDAQTPQQWPMYPQELTQDSILIPQSLELFLTVLLTGHSDTQKCSSRSYRITHSLAQDIVYHVSTGRNKQPKHILLPWAVKSITGNTETIRLLNRLGHGISYTKLEELETALCLEKLWMEEHSGTALPSGIFPHVPTVLAFDNIDRLEETLSGAGTSHRVNGIIVQPRVIGPLPPPRRENLPRERKRTLPPQNVVMPPYYTSQRKSPPAVSLGEPTVLEDSASMLAREKNLVWSLLRQQQPTGQTISAWTGFNIVTRQGSPSITKDTIGYLPTINAPATNMSTVHQVLVKAMSYMNSLQLSEIVCVFDQALYAKAAEIVWNDQARFSPIILRMGTFHTMCNLLSILGKRFGDAGLRDLAVENNIIAEGSISKVLDGRHYNRGVRLHKIVYEGLLRLLWQGFFSEIESRQSLRDVLDVALQELGAISSNPDSETMQKLLSHQPTVRILNLFSQYCDEMRNERGPMAAFWMTYVDIVEILLAMIRASREGNWSLHLHSVRSLLPWCFAYDKVNYARYLSVYLAQMSRLVYDHPEIYKQMMDGGFSVQLSDNNPFGRVPVDQTLEETINKDTQTAGGTKGFSLNTSAVARYYLSAEFRSVVLRQIRQLTDGDEGERKVSHPDLGNRRMQKDERDVQAVSQLLQTSWVHPFAREDTQISSLSTGIIVPDGVKKDLIRAEQVGRSAAKQFVDERLSKGEKFYDPLTKLKLKTFASMQVTKKTAAGNREIMLKADNRLFGRMLLIGCSRQLDMQEVLRHPLGTIPWALANHDGSLKKTAKAALANHLESGVLPEETTPRPSAAIIDGMGLVQKLDGNKLTFVEISERLLKMALASHPDSKRVDVVFDIYLDSSIKDAERVNRGANRGILFSQIVPTHTVRNWRGILSSPASKRQLTRFVANDWQQRQSLIGEKELYVTADSKCLRITQDTVMEVRELDSSHEEADTRVLLHASHAARSGFKSVVIVAEDTDILVLLLAFNAHISTRLCMRLSSKGRIRLFSIDTIEARIGLNGNSLLGLHAFTGCDSVSAFSGMGKIKGLKLMRGNKEFLDALSKLGSEWTLNRDVVDTLQAFTCQLYASRTHDTEVNALRFNLWRAKKGVVESGQLPPCADTLNQHMLRANYQAAVWRRSLDPKPYVPAPENHGWRTTDDGRLEICWMTGLPAPQVVLDFMFCECRKACEPGDCVCLDNNLPCTDECRLKDCSNTKDSDLVLDVSDDESSDNDESDDED